MSRIQAIIGFVLGAAVGTSGAVAASPKLPNPATILAWTPAEQQAGYPRMEAIFPHRIVRRGKAIHALPLAAEAIDPTYVEGGKVQHVDDFMERNHTVAVVVLHRGQLVLERYAEGVTAQTRWTSFSMSKSITSTLLGAAIADGSIKSVNDQVTLYIPELKRSAYDGVSIADALMMRSGVKWNEDYSDPNSDVGRMAASMFQNQGDNLIDQMRALPREAVPGAKFVYKTGESNLIGRIITRATGKSLSDYLSQKIWTSYGMEQDAIWVTNGKQEISGCCLSISARDYARFGQYVLDNYVITTRSSAKTLPLDWLNSSVKPYTTKAWGKRGYGYQWWVYPDGGFGADGIFGQSISIYPAEDLVVVILSAWPAAEWEEGYTRQDAFIASIRNISSSSFKYRLSELRR